MDFKVKHVRRFLEGGNKVRLAVVFRGREITHPKTGMNVLNRVVELCADIATVEATPNMEGRRMIMVIAPKPNVVRKAAEAKKAAVAAQQAALAQKKDQPGAKRPVPEAEDDELDEDEINADVIDDDDDDEDEPTPPRRRFRRPDPRLIAANALALLTKTPAALSIARWSFGLEALVFVRSVVHKNHPLFPRKQLCPRSKLIPVRRSGSSGPPPVNSSLRTCSSGTC